VLFFFYYFVILSRLKQNAFRHPEIKLQLGV